MTIDLRSDTVTKPSKEMLEAMFSAEVGDDVFGDDPTVKALENKAAEMFGMEAALFCTSGTMTNQIALKAHLFPGSEVICDKYSHIYLYEGGGIASNAQASVKLIDGDKGRITAEQVRGAINNPEDIHLPLSTLVSLENTMNKGGGSIYDFDEILKIKEVCREKGLKFHLDGARLFNALIETSESPKDFGSAFDSISICLSKGLGAPVGSLLLGNAEFIKKSRRIRKSFGGGWRQAGYLAAAGIYALDNNVKRLKEDHANAKAIGQILQKCSFVKEIMPIDTNIVIFELVENWTNTDFLEVLKQNGVGAVAFGPQLVRFVTHLDFKTEDLNLLEKILTQISK
ncbi:threonine aldolase family protein [Lacihabitans soyangensis]|uniref:Threonine aldolase n=1 Tax=Lacihabitans soyangensis TaxID=869394 RepID=A0AAE3H1Y5_9BACT|nr:GntG family PLP-dependent aldolase [Lacihabitans soyangensis]MCP9761340.1 threonine aldolase [Lacihabitans soyangensis]